MPADLETGGSFSYLQVLEEGSYLEEGPGKWVDNWRRKEKGLGWQAASGLEANFQVCEELEPALHSWERGKGLGGRGGEGEVYWWKIVPRGEIKLFGDRNCQPVGKGLVKIRFVSVCQCLLP